MSGSFNKNNIQGVTTSTLRTGFVLGFIAACGLLAPVVQADVIISEFMASNSRTLADGDKEYSDWIELFNNGAAAVSLEGWGLSTSSGDPFEWVFPAVTLGAGSRLVVFASGKDRTDPASELHTNFKLSAAGEYLALTDPQEKVHTEFSPVYPRQYSDVSYGESASSNTKLPIKQGSTLSYYIPQQEDTTLDANWMSPGFASAYPEKAAQFKTGTSGVGYEVGSEEEPISAVTTILGMQPEGYWRLNEAQGTTYANSGTKGSEYDLQVEGAVEMGSPGVWSESIPGFGEDNLGAGFGTKGAYATANQSLMNDLTSFTIAGWVKMNSYNQDRAGLFGQNDAVEFGLINGTQLHLWCSGGASMYVDVNLTLGEWYHIAAVGTGEYLYIYLNGTFMGYRWSSVSTYGNSSYPFTIGARTFDAENGEFDGDIDEVIFCSQALDSTQIESLYNSAADKYDSAGAISSLNPLAWWGMEWENYLQYNTGTLGYDISTSARNVTQVAGPRPSDGFPGFLEDNYAASFTGNVRMEISHSDELNAKEFTISAWVKPTQKSGISPIYSSRNYNPHNGFVLMIDADGKWSFALAETGTAYAYATGGAADYGKWSLVMGTYDGTTARLYVNGVEVASKALSGFVQNLTGGRPERIGYGSPTSGDYFSGAVDEVFYLNRAMTSAECSQMYGVAIGDASGSTETVYYLTDYIKTNVQEEMMGKSSTAYLRYPFELEGTDNLEEVTLKIRYVDGFTAWLNGHQILAENAPEAPTWASTATADRLPRTGVTASEYNLTDYKGFLQNGENVLAIQGVNHSAEDTDFLISPEVTVAYSREGANDWRYFTVPSPGKANGEGAADLGPIITDMNFTPNLPIQPTPTTPVVVTVRVTPSQSAVSSVQLTWRVMFGAMNVVAMLDDGQGDDAVAGDGVYTATIPSGVALAGQMIRWYITATDALEHSSRWPLYYNKTDSAEYFGTVVQDDSIDSLLPVLQLFVSNTSAMNNATDTRISAFYNGEFYDNILIGRRGQTTAGFSKKPYKLDFNKDHRFMYGTNTARVGKVNLMSNYADKSKMRNSMAYEYINAGGSAGHWCFPIRVQRNAAFFSVCEMLENGTDEWIERIGWDSDGLLYKVYDNLSSAGNAEKKTRGDATESADRQAYQTFINSLNETISLTNRVIYAYDHINIPQSISYFATLALISSQDHGHKNFYVYQDSNVTGEWSLLPWDVDLCFGRNWLDSPGYLSDTIYTNNVLNFYNSSQQGKDSNRYYNLFFGNPDFRMMYLTRLRTLVDTYLQNETMPASESPVAASVNRYLDSVDPESAENSDADKDTAAWSSWGTRYTMREDAQRIIDIYAKGRAEWLTTSPLALLNGNTLPAATPADTVIKIINVDFMAYSKEARHKYICLTNENSYAVDISDWKLTGPVDFTFRPGTVLPAGKGIYVTPGQAGFRTRLENPTANQALYITGPWIGTLTARPDTVNLFDRANRLVSEYTYKGSPSTLMNNLRVTEIMYNPLPLLPDYPNGDDLEYIELKNVNTSSIINLNGVSFTKGIQYSFTESLRLTPQSRVIIAKNPMAFKARYGEPCTVLGPYEGTLSNSGEVICLVDSNNEVILEFEYKDSWQPLTDGEGYSLVCTNDQAEWTAWSSKSTWRTSLQIYGAPGREDTAPTSFPLVKVNELLANTAEGQLSAIELFNADEKTADISNWYLSNEYGTPKKYQFPTGTTIAAGGYLVLDSSVFNADPAAATSFELNRWGGEVWIFSAGKTGLLTGYSHGFAYGPQEKGITFGRLETSLEEDHFVAQSANTLGAANAGALINDVVFAELMYHPITETDLIRDEYIKLVNRSSSPISLFNEEAGCGWSFTEGVDFTFKAGDTIPARGVMLIVSFNPLKDTTSLNEFMANYEITEWNERVVITGPYSGKLSNSGETVKLVRPKMTPEGTAVEIIVDALTYQDSDPWPGKADGKGGALQRRDLDAYPDDPANWRSKTPSPNVPLEFVTEPPVVASFALTEEAFVIDLATSATGCTVQVTPSLDAATWEDVPAVINGNTVTIRHTDNRFTGSTQEMYYRVYIK